MEELELVGTNYSGVFLGESKSEPYRFRNDTHDRHNYWWEGQGKIVELETGQEQRFLFNSGKFFRRYGSLEEAVVKFNSRREGGGISVNVRQPAVVNDLVLSRTYQDAKIILANPKVIIPRVVIHSLDIDELKDTGLVTRK